MLREALTFDDVLLVPAASSILPTDADTIPKLQKKYHSVFPSYLPLWTR